MHGPIIFNSRVHASQDILIESNLSGKFPPRLLFSNGTDIPTQFIAVCNCVARETLFIQAVVGKSEVLNIFVNK